MLFVPLVARFCATLIAALCIGGGTGYDPYATQGVYFMGTQVGVYEDDQQPDQCQDAAIEAERWPLVIAAVAPGNWPQGQCAAATYNALEWGQYWGPPPPAQAYVIESAALGPLPTWPRLLAQQTLKSNPALLVFWWPTSP